jgi:basic amino acid/polyamine antiporter, APA family
VTTNNWHPKLGDKFFHPKLSSSHLRKSLGITGLFSSGYGNVGSSIYYGLGLVALAALGLTPIALMIAGLIFVANSLSYAEGGAMIPEGGGSASFARHAFSDLIGFIAGWALMLTYVVTMAISAFTIPPYLAHFWPILKEPLYCTLGSIIIVALLMLVNIAGIRESSRLNIVFIVIDIATQVSLVVMGVIFILWVNPEVLVQNMFGPGNVPNFQGFIMGIALAALCFTGVETISQLAEETKRPGIRIPRAYFLLIFVVLLLFAGISVVALATMTPHVLGDPINGWAKDPIAGIAANMPNPVVRDIFEPLVALLAASILLTGTNAGLIGISRLSFNMSRNNLIPPSLARVHSRFRTPYISIIFFCIIVVILLIPGFFNPIFFVDLSGLYVFGSLLGFSLAHASIIGLRIFQPDKPRPFMIKGNISIGRRKIPLVAVFGLLATFSIWILIIVTQPFSRWVGFTWMIAGFLLFYLFRRYRHLPFLAKLDRSGKSQGQTPSA